MMGSAGMFNPYFLAFIVSAVVVLMTAMIFVLVVIILLQVRWLLEIKIKKDQILLLKLREDSRG